MNLKEYQEKALVTYKVKENKMTYLKLGIRGEAGEVCDKVKKLIRDHGWKPGTKVEDEELRHGLMLELGDVMWYAVVTDYEDGFSGYWHNKSYQLELNSIGSLDKDDLAECAMDLYDCVTSRINTVEVIVYVATIAKILGVTLENVCMANIEKLASRMQRGKIGGSGDYR